MNQWNRYSKINLKKSRALPGIFLLLWTQVATISRQPFTLQTNGDFHRFTFDRLCGLAVSGVMGIGMKLNFHFRRR